MQTYEQYECLQTMRVLASEHCASQSQRYGGLHRSVLHLTSQQPWSNEPQFQLPCSNHALQIHPIPCCVEHLL